MEYEYTPVMPHHGSQTYSGPPGPRPSRCPYAGSGRHFMDLPAAYTPSWQPSPMPAQRWSPHGGPRLNSFPLARFSDPNNILNLDAGVSSPGTYPNYTPPAAPAPPQSSNPPPSSGTAANTTTSMQEDSQTAPSQGPAPTTNASLGPLLGITPAPAAAPSLSAGPSPQYTSAPTNSGSREGHHSVNATAASSQPTSARLPVPTSHAQYSRPARPRLSSGRIPLPEELRAESSRVTTDGSGPSTSSSDDDSDLELGPRVRFMGYHHTTRQSQILRGQMTNKRVASRKAVQSLQEVDMETLSESEKSKLAPRHPAYREGKHSD